MPNTLTEQEQLKTGSSTPAPTVGAEARAHPEGKDSGGRPWLRSFRAAATVWLITHVAYVLITCLAFFQSDRPVPKDAETAFASWENWDTEWFVWISQHGYLGYHSQGLSHNMDSDYSAAFFPLYSLLIRALSSCIGHPLLSALILAWAAEIGAFMVLYRLAEQEFDRASAGRTLWFLVAMPTGFYLGMAYNASLYLLLAVGALYLMRQGKWWEAGAVCGLATATRSVAVLLVVPFAYEYLRQHDFKLSRFRPDFLGVLLVPSGITAFAAYLKYAFGDPLHFSHVQSYWHRELDYPWIGIYQTFKVLRTTKHFYANDVRNLVDIGVTLLVIVALVLCFVGPWKYRRDQWFLPLFGVVSLLFIITFPSSDPINRVPLLSAGRLCLEVFPAFMVMGRIGRNQAFDRAICFIGPVVQGLWLTHFLLSHFIG